MRNKSKYFANWIFIVKIEAEIHVEDDLRPIYRLNVKLTIEGTMNRLDYVDCILDTATLEWDFNETPWTVRKVAEADTVGHLKKSQKDINRFNGAYDGDPGLEHFNVKNWTKNNFKKLPKYISGFQKAWKFYINPNLNLPERKTLKYIK